MKVVWVVRQAEGGILGHLHNLLQGLSGEMDITILGPKSIGQKLQCPTFQEVDVADGLHFGREWRVVWQIRDELRRIKPEIVHMHGLKSVLVTVPAARLSRCRRLLFTAHNCLPNHQSRWKELTHGLVQRNLLQSLHAIISVSDAVRDQILGYVPEHRVITVRNGISSASFGVFSRAQARAAAGIRVGELVVGTVARLTPEKGIGTLLEAASLLKKVIPQVRFVIVGDGPSRAHFEAYRDALQLRGVVDFLGFREDVPLLLAGYDIYALPTLSEGFSLSVLEAMASRLPVVVSDVPSMREMVVAGRSGLVVPPRDAPGFAAALLHLLKDLPKARAMGEYNGKRVQTLFGTERMVQCTRDIYHNLTSDAYSG